MRRRLTYRSALEAKRANWEIGHQIDLTNRGDFDASWDSIQNLRNVADAPGVANIPVCEWHEVEKNYAKKHIKNQMSRNYPCN